jgi:transcriptional antiterminator RfaH
VLDSATADQPPWYVVHCKPKSERIALEHLERQGFVCYLPMLKVFARQKASLVRMDAMFPRYLFCKTKDDTQSLAPIRSTQGVLGLVRFGAEPAQLGGGIVAQIRALETAQHDQQPAQLSQLQMGDAVRVIAGPLTTLEGMISKVSNERISVLLELLGKPLNLNLKLSEITKI